jgi:O-antigen/teichoic acid export membrane protein
MKTANSDKSRVFWNSFFMNVSSIVEKVTFFIMTVVIARYLSREHYGEYATAMGLATFFAIITNLSINISIIRAINKYRQEKNYYFTISILLKLILSIVSYGFLVAVLYSFDYSESTRTLAIVLGLVRIGTEIITTLYAFLESDEKFGVIAILISFFSIILLAGTLGVIALKGDYFQLADIRLYITGVFLAISYYLIKKGYHYQFSIKLAKSFIKSVIPFAISFIAVSINLNAGIILLPILQDTTSAGVYQNAYIFITSIGFIAVNMIRVLLPYLYKFNYRTNKDKFQFAFDVYSKVLTIMAFYIVLGTLLYADAVIPVVFGGKYNDSIDILKILSVSIPFSFTIAGALIVTIDKQSMLSLFDSVGACIIIISSYFLIGVYGAHGAAWSYVFTAFILFILTNLYLIIHAQIKYFPTLITFIKMLIISSLLYYLFNKYTTNINVILSGLAMTAIYIISILVFVIKRNDIRIIREIIR